MALTPEEKAQLDALTAKANTPDDDDFDIEIWDEKGAGARVPYRKGKTWLQRFGIDLPEPATEETEEPGTGKPTRTRPAASGPASVTPAAKYFGNKQAS
jgi:hypothetical protein